MNLSCARGDPGRGGGRVPPRGTSRWARDRVVGPVDSLIRVSSSARASEDDEEEASVDEKMPENISGLRGVRASTWKKWGRRRRKTLSDCTMQVRLLNDEVKRHKMLMEERNI